MLDDAGRTQLEHNLSFAELERRPPPGAAADDPDIAACAHARMDEGLTAPCARLLAQCGPVPTSVEVAFYVVWHLLVSGGMLMYAAVLVAGPCAACALRKRLAPCGGLATTAAVYAVFVAGLVAFVSSIK